ncbi:MAG TPA: hypothetical protein VFK06_02445 [Candidatus Angelobacter sp.]|nr:hypothetical protein [Candidatus Angelobacter sp.]
MTIRITQQRYDRADDRAFPVQDDLSSFIAPGTTAANTSPAQETVQATADGSVV